MTIEPEDIVHEVPLVGFLGMQSAQGFGLRNEAAFFVCRGVELLSDHANERLRVVADVSPPLFELLNLLLVFLRLRKRLAFNDVVGDRDGRSKITQLVDQVWCLVLLEHAVAPAVLSWFCRRCVLLEPKLEQVAW